MEEVHVVININAVAYITKFYFKGYLVPQNKLKHPWNKCEKKNAIFFSPQPLKKYCKFFSPWKKPTTKFSPLEKSPTKFKNIAQNVTNKHIELLSLFRWKPETEKA